MCGMMTAAAVLAWTHIHELAGYQGADFHRTLQGSAVVIDGDPQARASLPSLGTLQSISVKDIAEVNDLGRAGHLGDSIRVSVTGP